MLFHAPLLWVAVLLGAASAALTGYVLVLPWSERLEGWGDLLRAGIPWWCGLSRRWALPVASAVFALGFIFWMIRYPLEGVLLLSGTVVLVVLLKKFPRWRKNRMEQDRRRRCLEVFPQALEMTVQTLQVGQTLPQAVSYLSREAPQPLRDEFAVVSMEMELGSSPEDALSKLAVRLDHPDLSRFLEAYRFSRRAGANLVHLYQTQLEGIEESHRLLRRLDSMTAQARLSGLMMGSLPVMLLAVLFVMDSDLLVPLFKYPAGWAVLAVAVLLETLGFLWIQKLLKVEV